MPLGPARFPNDAEGERDRPKEHCQSSKGSQVDVAVCDPFVLGLHVVRLEVHGALAHHCAGRSAGNRDDGVVLGRVELVDGQRADRPADRREPVDALPEVAPAEVAPGGEEAGEEDEQGDEGHHAGQSHLKRP